MSKKMEKEFMNIKMVINMRANINIIRRVVKELFITKMVISN